MNVDVKKKFINNTIWLLLERIIKIIIWIFIGALSARYLGTKNYGTINYTLSIVNFWGVIVGLGLESYIIKEIVEDKANEGEVIGTAILMKVVASVIGIIGILITMFLLKPTEKEFLLIALLQSLHLTFKSLVLIDSWFQSTLNSKYAVICKSLAVLGVGLWQVILLIKGAGVEFFALTITVENFVLGFSLLYLYKYKKGPKLIFSFKKAKVLISNSYHFIITGFLITIYGQIDKIMIGNILGDAEVGIYSVAIMLSNVWVFIPMAFITSARPLILEAKANNDQELYLKRLKKLFSLIIYLGTGVAIIFSVFSKLIIYILYGAEYIQATTSLVIIVWSTIFSLLGTARSIWIVAEGYNRYSKYIVGIGAVVNVVLNVTMLDKYGIEAAAISTLIAQLTVACIAPLFIKEMRNSVKYMFQALLLKEVK